MPFARIQQKGSPILARCVAGLLVCALLAACSIPRDPGAAPPPQSELGANADGSAGERFVASSKDAGASPDPSATPPASTESAVTADSAPSAATTAAPPAPASPSGTSQLATHTIRAGDTLTEIAERYGVSISALLKLNDLPNPDLLKVGQVIALPPAPVDYSPALRILPDSRLARSVGASNFDTAAFLGAQGGLLPRLTATAYTRHADGTAETLPLSGAAIIDRVSREYSVDPRALLLFLEHYASLVTAEAVEGEKQAYPLLAADQRPGRAREGLYSQLSWLADQLNKGYYDWKYRGETILEVPDGSRLFYEPSLNAGTVAVQFAAAQVSDPGAWAEDIGEAGLLATYRRLFGDPFAGARETAPADLRQPELTLPFPRGDQWRFTGGFHGGWGNGSAWSAIDFAPPDDIRTARCYTSKYPITAVAAGLVARLEQGAIVLDLDGDGDEGSGWTILYLHVSPHETLQAGQALQAGNILGYASCIGGFSTATHLHIARRYNGEWIPADCNRCPAGRAAPPFVMSNWKVVGLGSQLYQGFLVNELDNRNVIAEQGRFSDVNVISW